MTPQVFKRPLYVILDLTVQFCPHSSPAEYYQLRLCSGSRTPITSIWTPSADLWIYSGTALDSSRISSHMPCVGMGIQYGGTKQGPKGFFFFLSSQNPFAIMTNTLNTSKRIKKTYICSEARKNNFASYYLLLSFGALLPRPQACAAVFTLPCVYFSSSMSAVTPSRILNMLTTLEIVTLASLIRPRIPRITAPPRSDLCPDLPLCPPPAPPNHRHRQYTRWAQHGRVVISCPHTLNPSLPQVHGPKKTYRRYHAGELKYSRS